jgi:hypothetical protein
LRFVEHALDVTVRLGEFALLADKPEFFPQPRFERVKKGAAFLLPDDATFVGAAAADTGRAATAAAELCA